MATSRLFCYILWAHVPGRTQKQFGPERDRNSPRPVQDRSKQVSHTDHNRSSRGHMIIDGACITIPFESGMGGIATEPMLLQNRSKGFGNPEKSNWPLAVRSLLRNFGIAARRHLHRIRHTSAAKCEQKMATEKHGSCGGGRTPAWQTKWICSLARAALGRHLKTIEKHRVFWT